MVYAKQHLQAPFGPDSARVAGLSAACGIHCTRPVRQAALAGALWPRLGKGGRPQRCMCTRAVRHAAALASVALICLLLCASTSHYDNIATLLPADKDVLRLMQLADRFLMEDCVRRCATLLNQIPVSRCCLNRHLSSSKLAVVDCEGKCLSFTLMAIVAPISS